MTEIDGSTPPHAIFDTWMKEAAAHSGIKEPSAMTLATVSASGMPHGRVVLCKQWTAEGFSFFTNYNSKKGHELASNPNAAAVFYWDAMLRQVKIAGRVEKTSRQTSIDYWASRPRDSQISQYISRQSETAPSRGHMEQAWKDAEQEFSGREIPCPEHWGGYLLRPELIEFWIARPGRLHDRFEFKRSDQSWTFRRLYP